MINVILSVPNVILSAPKVIITGVYNLITDSNPSSVSLIDNTSSDTKKRYRRSSSETEQAHRRSSETEKSHPSSNDTKKNHHRDSEGSDSEVYAADILKHYTAPPKVYGDPLGGLPSIYIDARDRD